MHHWLHRGAPQPQDRQHHGDGGRRVRAQVRSLRQLHGLRWINTIVIIVIKGGNLFYKAHSLIQNLIFRSSAYTVQWWADQVTGGDQEITGVCLWVPPGSGFQAGWEGWALQVLNSTSFTSNLILRLIRKINWWIRMNNYHFILFLFNPTLNAGSRPRSTSRTQPRGTRSAAWSEPGPGSQHLAPASQDPQGSLPVRRKVTGKIYSSFWING